MHAEWKPRPTPKLTTWIFGTMLGTIYDNKKSPPRNPLLGRNLQKRLDFVPRTGFEFDV